MTEEGQRSSRFLESKMLQTGSDSLSVFCRLLHSLLILFIMASFAVAAPLYAADADADGVPDTHDDYPSDASKVRDLPASLAAIGDKLSVWLDASSSKNYELDSNYVDAVYDLSGNQYHGDFENTSRRPTYSENGNLGTVDLSTFEMNDDVIRLGTSSELGIQNSNYEVIIAGRNTRSGYATIMYGSNARYDFAIRDRNRFRVGHNGTHREGSGQRDIHNKSLIYSLRVDDATSSYYVQAGNYISQQLTSGSQGTDVQTIYIGARNNGGEDFEGSIGEVIIINDTITSAQRQAIWKYLRDKWGIGDSYLDSDVDGALDVMDSSPLDNTQMSSDIPAEVMALKGNMEVWYRADNVATNNNGTVTQLFSMAGTNMHSTNTNHFVSWNAKAVSGKPALHFPRKDDKHQFYQFPSLSNVRTVFAVVKRSEGTNEHRTFLGHGGYHDFHAGNNGKIFNASAHSYAKDGQIWQDNVALSNSGDYQLDKFKTHFHVFNIQVNGNLRLDRLGQDRGYHYRSWDGEIAEYIIFKTTLSSTQRTQVYNYLKDRYKLYEDEDSDGVRNAEDDFPTDPAASKDGDKDGAADFWNVGKTQADSTLGLTLDKLPNMASVQEATKNNTLPVTDGLALWIDGNEPMGAREYQDNEALEYFYDFSSAHRHSETNNPSYSPQVVKTPDGSKNLIYIETNSHHSKVNLDHLVGKHYTVFTLTKTPRDSSWRYIFSSGHFQFRYYNDDFYVTTEGGAEWIWATIPDEGFTLWRTEQDNTSRRSYVDGVEVFNKTNRTGVLHADLGNTNVAQMKNSYIAEVAVYDRVLSESESAQVEAHLRAKWLTGDADSDGVLDLNDMFPNDPRAWKDSDRDGYPDSFVGDYTALSNGNLRDMFPTDPSRNVLDHTYRTSLDVKEGLFAWYDGAEPLGKDGITSDNLSISEWVDMSFNGNNLEQVNDTYKPKFKLDQLNEKPSVKFDGNNYMIKNKAENYENEQGKFTLIVVANQDDPSSYRTFATLGRGNVEEAYSIMGNSKRFRTRMARNSWGSVADYQDNADEFVPDESRIMTLRRSNVEEMFVNGKMVYEFNSGYTGGFTTYSDAFIGLGQRRKDTNAEWRMRPGEINEVLFYNRELSGSELASVYKYLNAKWDLFADADNDGIEDSVDDYPTDPSASKDTDGDGYPDELHVGYTEMSDGKVADEVPELAAYRIVPEYISSRYPQGAYLRHWYRPGKYLGLSAKQLEPRNINVMKDLGLYENHASGSNIPLEFNIQNNIPMLKFTTGHYHNIHFEDAMRSDYTVMVVYRRYGTGGAYFFKRDGGGPHNQLGFGQDASRVYIHHYSNDLNQTVSGFTTNEVMVMTYKLNSKEGREVYHDRNLVASDNRKEVLTGQQRDMRLGRFDGHVIETLIWDKALTQEELTEAWNSIDSYLDTDDDDNDGVQNGLDDFPNDPAASLDSDWDGSPDEWNDGKSASDSTSTPKLYIDLFPNDFKVSKMPTTSYTVPVTSGLKLWLDGSAPYGVDSADKLGEGSLLSMLPDFSGNGNHATAYRFDYIADYLPNKYNGKGALNIRNHNYRYNVNMDYLNNSDFTIFYIGERYPTHRDYHIYTNSFYLDGYKREIRWHQAGNTAYGALKHYAKQELNLWTHTFDQTTGRKTYRQGLKVFEDDFVTPLTGITTGFVAYANRPFAEVLIYNRKLSDSERESVESYLQSKYGLDIDADGDGTADYNDEMPNEPAGDTDYDKDGHPDYLLGDATVTSTNKGVDFFPKDASLGFFSHSYTLPVTDGLFGWFDGAEPMGASANLEDDTELNYWIDFSGNYNNLEQTNSSRKPQFKTNRLNGKPSVYFDGADYMFKRNIEGYQNTSRHTLFVVGHMDSYSSYRVFATFSRSNGHEGYNLMNYNNRVRTRLARSNWDSHGDYNDNEDTLVNGTSQLLTLRTGKTDQLLVNTEVVYDINSSHTGRFSETDAYFSVGQRYYNDNGSWRMTEGDINEVIYFNRELTDTEFAQINKYLNNKWNLFTDSDNDGIADEADMFPTDPAASVDRDADGYPDSFHVGYTETADGKGVDEVPEMATYHKVPKYISDRVPQGAFLRHWYRSDKVDGPTTRQLTARNVSRWNDLGLYSNDATGSNVPLEFNIQDNIPLMKFTTSWYHNVHFESIKSRPYTMVFLYRRHSTGGEYFFKRDGGGTNGRVQFGQRADRLIQSQYGNDYYGYPEENININEFIVVTMTLDPNKGRTMYLGREEIESDTRTETFVEVQRDVRMGRIDAHFAEVLLWDTALTEGELEDVWDYLDARLVTTDTDNDGVQDGLDDFPNDPAASVDSDWDGYPDFWNDGKSQSDSTSSPALEIDVFPNDMKMNKLPAASSTVPVTSGLKVWLDGSSPYGVSSNILNEGDKIALLPDFSGNGNHADSNNLTYQAPYIKDKYNGKGALDIINHNYRYKIPIDFLNDSNFTIFYVGQRYPTHGDYQLYASNQLYFYGYKKEMRWAQAGQTTYHDLPHYTKNDLNLWSHTFDKNSGRKSYRQGNLVFEDTFKTAPTGMTTAQIAYANEPFAELLIYDRKLSDSERQTVENYLKAKFGLNIDADGDGTADMNDQMPNDAAADADTDGDGYPDYMIGDAVVTSANKGEDFFPTNASLGTFTHSYTLPVTDGLFGWYDGAEPMGSSYNYTANEELRYWVDFSGNKNNLEQTNSSRKPKYKLNAQNSKPSVYFDGDDFITKRYVEGYKNSSKFTLIVVGHIDSYSSYRTFAAFGRGNETQGYLLMANTRTMRARVSRNNWGSEADYQDGTETLTNGVSKIMTLRRASGETMYVNGQNVHEFNSNYTGSYTETDAYITLGQRRSHDHGEWRMLAGDINEVLYFNRDLSDNEMVAINKYLNEKWGLFADTDNDGVTNGQDAFPNDPAASLDADEDGYPDAWHIDMNEDDSTSDPALILDAFPDDASKYKPEIKINSPTEGGFLAYSGSTETIEAKHTLGEGFSGQIRYKLDSEFPESGLAGGTLVSGTPEEFTIPVQPNQAYKIHIALADRFGYLITGNTIVSANFFMADDGEPTGDSMFPLSFSDLAFWVDASNEDSMTIEAGRV